MFEITVEVLDARSSAEAWWQGYGDRLIAIAHEYGLRDWRYHVHSWGIVVELLFDKERHWNRFLGLPGVQAILDAVPDRINGFIIQDGWGGTGRTRFPRRPRPFKGAGAAELPIPMDEPALLDAIANEIARNSRDLTRAAS
jgi:hypothetical protein